MNEDIHRLDIVCLLYLRLCITLFACAMKLGGFEYVVHYI